MKQIIILILVLSFCAICHSQQTNSIDQLEAVYEGYTEEGYLFCHVKRTGNKQIIIFNNILSVILEKYPLHTDVFIGIKFIISFTTKSTFDKEGQKQTSTILRLQRLTSG